jgi:hypothetical protein
MSDRENDQDAQAIDPPENTRADAMNMDSTDDPSHRSAGEHQEQQLTGHYDRSPVSPGVRSHN